MVVTPSDRRLAERERGVIEAADRAGAERVVLVSTLGAAPDGPVELSRWHAAAERAADSARPAAIPLRLGFFMQNLLGFAPTVAASGAIHTADGDGRIAMIDTRDVGEAAAEVPLADEVEVRRYHLTGPEAFSFADAAAAITVATGREVRHVDVPPDAVRRGMIAGGAPDWLADEIVTLFAMFRAGGGEYVSPDLAGLIGHQDRTIRQFAMDHAATFLSD